MSWDTENHNIFLKKLLKNVCKIKMESIPKVKGQKPVFLFIKEFGRTWPANEFSCGYMWETQVSKFVSELTHRRRDHSTRNAGPRAHTSKLERVSIPSRMFIQSILNAGLIAGGREGCEIRHTMFFTP